MSVVVRMEMPEGCWRCQFGHYDWIWGDDGREEMVCFCCLDLESEEDGHYLLETELKRPSWCPIICSLPEGHGRLIDADAFEKDVSNALVYGLKEIPSVEGKQIFHVFMQEVLDNMKKRKNIVPAEAERRKQDAD